VGNDLVLMPGAMVALQCGESRPDESTAARFAEPGAPPQPLHPPTAHALELLASYLRSGSFQVR